MVRNFSTAQIKQQQTESNSKDGGPIDAADLVMNAKWRTIFKFPFIRHIASLNKVKMYHTAFTLVFIPTSIMIPEYLNPVIGKENSNWNDLYYSNQFLIF